MFFWRMGGIKAFTVHERPNPPSARDDRAEALVFVRDGFSLFAALVPAIWMAVNRLWLALAGYLAIVFALTIAFGLASIPDVWLGYAVLALNLIVGFEADSLRRWTLDRRAWRQIAVVTGRNAQECERRFFDQWLATVPAVSPSNFTPPGTPGGLETSISGGTQQPVTGEVMPPKRTGWRSAVPWRS